MFLVFSKKANLHYIFVLIMIMEIIAFARTDYSVSGREHISEESTEMITLKILGLSEDVNDDVIVQLLDIPNKRIHAITLIEYRKISSAIPKLLQIINDSNNNNANIIDKISASEALCILGNRQWMPIIKALSSDPNGMISRTTHKYEVAGLLAQGGDFSQFEVIVRGLSDEKDFIRSKAIYELGKFAHPTDPVTDKAAELLTGIAKCDKNNKFREYAIDGLEKLAREKPTLKNKVIEVLEANIDSPDKNLQAICKAKLMMYKKQSEPNNPPK
jgi:hypothetical protein